MIYLLKSTACLGILLLVYLLFLEKEKMHRFNRWYLLGSIVFSFVVPLISFSVTAETLPLLQADYFVIGEEPLSAVITQASPSPVAAPVVNGNIVPFTMIVYALVTLVLLTRFVRNLYRVLSGAWRNKTVPYRGAKLVLMNERTASYSFLHYVFINGEAYANNGIEEEIITHELTHVRQKHSWDVIFIELLQAVLWFNPLLIFYKKAIQLNHEYLADEAVIRTYADVPAYQLLLLDKTCSESASLFTSNFNYSITKKRLIMMTKNYNRVTALLKKITLVPVFAITLIVFSAKEMLAQQTKPNKVQDQKKVAEEIAPAIVPNPPYPPGSGASQEELNEYNAIIDKNITVTKHGHKTLPQVSPGERARMVIIYKHMNNAQRGLARAVFWKKPTPNPPKHPTAEQFEAFKNADVYGVWIGSKKINNEELNNYKAEDFGRADVSRLHYTEAMKKNIMKKFNLTKMYKYQVDLYKTEDAERDYKQQLASPPEYLMFRVGIEGDRHVLRVVK